MFQTEAERDLWTNDVNTDGQLNTPDDPGG